MRGPELNLRHLRAFAHVCNHGGISAASDDIHMSQPAITQAIAKLERDLGAKLFLRSNKGMFPTDAAKLLQHRTGRAFRMLHAGAGKSAGDHWNVPRRNFVDALTSTQLRALIAVSKHGNFSVTARALGVSQPSLHRAARDLEALASVPCFVRSSRGIDLTPEASRLAQAAGLAFGELDHAIDDLALQKGRGNGALRLGSLPLARGTILPRALDLLADRFPMCHIHVADTSFGEMLHALRHGEIDLMLGALRDPNPAPDIVQEPLFEDRLGIYCGPTHPLLEVQNCTKQTLARYPWVVARSGTPTRDHFNAYFREVLQADRGPILESNALVLVRGLLQNSERLTMISAGLAAEEVRMGTLRNLPVNLGDEPRLIGVTYRTDWRPTMIQARFLDILRNEVETTSF